MRRNFKHAKAFWMIGAYGESDFFIFREVLLAKSFRIFFLPSGGNLWYILGRELARANYYIHKR